MEPLPYIPYERFIVKITGNDLKQPVWSRRLKFRKTAQGIVDRFACFRGLSPELIDTKPPHKPKKKKSTKQTKKEKINQTDKKRQIMKTEDFQAKDFHKGEKVRYIPYHAKGDHLHPDCKNGVVSSVNIAYVFVKYNNSDCIMQTGDEPYTAQSTIPNTLIKL